MKTQLENIYTSAKADIDKALTINDIDEIRLKYLSRKGEFNSIKKGLKDLTDEEKRTVGAYANQITEELESLLKDSVHTGHHHVQHHQIDVLLIHQRQGIQPVLGGIYRVAAALQHGLHQPSCVGIVFHY